MNNTELQFAPGITQLSASIPIVNDFAVEETEMFSVILSTETAGVTLAPNESFIHITDDG